MAEGRCRNPACPRGSDGAPVDIYPGPGEFCPDCGKRLEPVLPPTPPTASRAARVPTARRRVRYLTLSGALALVLLGTLVGLHPPAIGHANGPTLRVCEGSLSRKVARDVVAAYESARNAVGQIAVGDGARGCDVRFFSAAAADAAEKTVLGRDGLVVVVNPLNPLQRLELDQLRRILTGEVSDWAQLGGDSLPIEVVVPNDLSDEGRLLAQRVLAGARLAHVVRRLDSSADVVAAVASAQGRGRLGIAAFSGAVPAKVVVLGSDPAPSLLSIAKQRYPLTVAVGVEVAGPSPPPQAAAIVRFAHSAAVQTIVARDGLVPLEGY